MQHGYKDAYIGRDPPVCELQSTVEHSVQRCRKGKENRGSAA
jgi:hypothetical protein